MFISDAIAATAPVAETGNLSGTLIQLALILLIFYFLLIRPQQKRNKAHQDMISALKVGDKVMTTGGIYGTVKKLQDEQILLEIAPNVEIKIERMAVHMVQNETKKVTQSKTKSSKK